LRGPAIRRAAVEVLLALPERPQALHYREWYEAVRAAGFNVAGKDPLAVFLAQISLSPVIRRAPRPACTSSTPQRRSGYAASSNVSTMICAPSPPLQRRT
jgi:hypothetical protein